MFGAAAGIGIAPSIGGAVGSDRMQAEGAAQQAKGATQKAVGSAKEAVKNVVDKA